MMGLSEAMNIAWGKAQAAAAIEPLLEQQVEYGLLEGHPKTLANHMVADVWAQKPELFEGKTGPKPHNIAIAAIALAASVRREAHQHNEALQSASLLALGLMLDEIARDAHAYPFHELDQRLLDAAAATFSEQAEEPGCSSAVMDWYGL
jgi:hypothetical protein